MLINKELTTNVYNKVHLEIQNETRTLSEIALRRKPKIELLKAISNSIQLLFNNLYSVTEQLIIINNSLNKKLSISETTYLKFLNENMQNEYLRYKKNRYFASKFNLIKKVSTQYKEVESQYMNLDLSGVINGNTRLDLSLDDYIFFIKNFFEKEKDYYKKEFNHSTHQEKVLNINPIGGPKYKKNTVKADTFETLELEKKQEKTTKKASNEVKKVKKIAIDSNINREELKNENGYFPCSVLPGIDINNIPKNFEIVDVIKNRDLIPDEVNNGDFKIAKYDYQENEFKEEFVYFAHRLFLQCVDPNSYGLKDGLLIITGTERERNFKSGYLCFRYYKGKFYLIENFNLPISPPRLTRTLYNWTYNNITESLSELYEAFYNKYPGGETVDE